MNVETTAKTLHLELTVREPEVIAELCKHPEGTERKEFALAALRLGVLAIRQASGAFDVQAIRGEGDRLVGIVRELLATTTTACLTNISLTLKSYFDPTEGHLSQRLDRLIKKDGELQVLLGQHLDGDDSVIARTLAKHIGTDSPLVRLLSPQEKQGVISTLTKAVEEQLQNQRETVLHQFSLDDQDSALARLVRELSGANGKLREDLAQDVRKLHDEFSLDNETGALSRLVGRVEKAQRTISDEFSLDNDHSALSRLAALMRTANSSINASLSLDDEKSPLYRLRRELLGIIGGLAKSSSEFHEDVKVTLESFKVRRQEAARSTRHGGEFEDAVGEMLQADCQRAGDVFEATGNKTGVISYCKVGDHVITLGVESAAPGTRIVVEAKEHRSYDLPKALKELEQARQNREAQIGLFVFSKATAPSGLEPFARHGKNIVVIWDRDDPASDLFLRAGVSVAKALVIREKLVGEKNMADAVALKAALVAISSDIKALDQITTWAKTVMRNGEKIGKKAGMFRKRLVRHLSTLERHLTATVH